MFLQMAAFIVAILALGCVGIIWAIWKENEEIAKEKAYEEEEEKKKKEQAINETLGRMQQQITSLEQHGREVETRFATIWHELESLRTREGRK